MTQEERWMQNYNEVMTFIEANHRNPSKHRIEEHLMLNWVKHNRKLLNKLESLESESFIFECEEGGWGAGGGRRSGSEK